MDKTLHLKFHGKILDQLGSQTYQSPVGSIAELVSNAWDADAKKVEIFLPDTLDENSTVIIKDYGMGMTFKECEERYLNVGLNRRGDDPSAKTPGGRPVLGRKGIGKFAGFGIAQKILVQTISETTGESTEFEMDIEKLSVGNFVNEGGDLNAKYDGPDKSKIEKHGTIITLKSLTLGKSISKEQFPKSMARRFLLQQTADDFDILVDNVPIPKSEDLANVEFTFPKDYRDDEKPEGLTMDDDWGKEKLPDGNEIKWKIYFFKDTIHDEELQGITVFCNGKLAQKPFFFNLSGGIGGQAGQAYMSGQIQADYVEKLKIDLVSTERQRINWALPETAPLEQWGKNRIKKLLTIWHDRRGQKRAEELIAKITGFSERLENLEKHEKKTVLNVLKKIGRVSTLTKEQFEDLGQAILTSWEGGRLKELWITIAESEDLNESELLEILVETEIVSALNIAEAIKTKLLAIAQLKDRLEKRELENVVRDHVAKNPWIISPKWETFRVETGVTKTIKDLAKNSGLLKDEYRGRVDLLLSSGDHLLVLEFMRPGLSLNWDHISRCEEYVTKIDSAVKAKTLQGFSKVTGYIIADNIAKHPEIIDKIGKLKISDIFVTDWHGLLEEATSSWYEYLTILISRGKGDKRLENLL